METWLLTSIIPGHWSSQHDFRLPLSDCLRQLYGQSERLIDRLCWNGGRDAHLWLHE